LVLPDWRPNSYLEGGDGGERGKRSMSDCFQEEKP